MDVLVEVRAVAGLAALEVDLLDEPGGGEVVEAIVNRGQRDVRRTAFHPIQDLVGGRMVRGARQHVKNLATVRGEPDIRTQHGETAVQTGGFGRSA